MENKIVVEPYGIVAEIEDDETILQALQRAGVKIAAYCNGHGICCKCKIRLIEGTFSGYGKINSKKENVSDLTSTEKSVLSQEEIEKGYRLACTTKVKEDIVIEIPSESYLGEQVILEEGKEKNVEYKPGVKVYKVKVNKPTLEDYSDDFTRVKNELIRMDSDISSNLKIGYLALRNLSYILRQGKWEAYIYVLYNEEIIKVSSIEESKYYGLAIDIGTTTIAVYLCDMIEGKQIRSTSLMNPQIKYGDDVLTRISYCLNNPNGREMLQSVLIKDLNKAIERLVEREKIKKSDILESVLVFNTVMEHIALNIPPDFIGTSPFAPAITTSLDIKANEIGLDIYPDGNIHCLPIEAAFVGADNVAVLIAEEPYKQDKMKLIIDIGTNSEICLGNSKKMYCTSCATGPALEGAQIYCGMRASEGAISKVLIDPDTLEPEYRIIKDSAYPIGICGSGIIDCVAQMALTGILDSDGKFSKSAKSHRIRNDENGRKEYVLYFAKNDNERDIVVKQKDVRAVQLAKAALYAGSKMLMKHCNIEKVDEVILAGGFGSYIDKKNALELGMYPDCNLANVTVSGNAAGVGAKLALLNVDKRKEAREIAGKIEFVETATDLDYQKMFAQAMSIPHDKDVFSENFDEKWTCQEEDYRYVPERVLKLGTDVFKDKSKFSKSVDIVYENENNNYYYLPLMQNIEAIAYGGKADIVGGVYAIKSYKFNKLEDLKIQKGDLIKSKEIQNVLSYIESHNDKNVLLDIEGPFSILSGLIGTEVIFKSRKKNTEQLQELLRIIADDLAEYVSEAVKRGVNVISLADPEGAIELVGAKFYKEYSGKALIYFMKKVEPYLNNAIIHICGKTSYGLTQTGMIVRKRFRVKDANYINILFDISKEKKIHFIGNACINKPKLDIPIVTKLEISEKCLF